MRLDTISEKVAPNPMGAAPEEGLEGLQTAPLGGDAGADGAEAMPAEEQPVDEQPGEDETALPRDEAGKADSAIDAVEKLRSAAAELDAAAFAMKTDYSDFTLAERIAQVKQELIYIINKAKEHVEYSAAKDPQAKQRVSQWLNT
jgi:hypothetical protein